MKNKRDNLAKKIGKELVGSECTSFAMGVKWADFHPDWREGTPNRKENQYGLPMLYLCQILTLDMTFGYRYSYRVGFITKEGQWNIERENCYVVRYMNIYCDETMEQLINKDIPSVQEKEEEEVKDNV